MNIVITANGLYFCGRVRDLRRFLAVLGSSPQPLTQYLSKKLG